ncbi:hypothetical protein MASR1M59_28920 [Melaminivora sp.]
MSGSPSDRNPIARQKTEDAVLIEIRPQLFAESPKTVVCPLFFCPLFFQLTVQDNGTGLTAPTPSAPTQPGASFGLAQVRERLATLYGDQGTLELIAAPHGGTRAIVTFPCESTCPSPSAP